MLLYCQLNTQNALAQLSLPLFTDLPTNSLKPDKLVLSVTEQNWMIHTQQILATLFFSPGSCRLHCVSNYVGLTLQTMHRENPAGFCAKFAC